MHLTPTLVVLDPGDPAPITVPWGLPLLPRLDYVESGHLRSLRGKAGNPSFPPPGQDSSILILKVLGMISSSQMEMRRGLGAIRASVQAMPLVLNPSSQTKGGKERHRSGTQMMQA